MVLNKQDFEGNRRFLMELRAAGFKTQMKGEHIKLVRGVYSTNPGHVLCPELVLRGHCHKKRKPELLIKHHAVEGLELWMCKGEGCQNFLIRVQFEA